MQDQIAQDLAKAKNLLGSASLIAVKGDQYGSVKVEGFVRCLI
ncbi:MAG: hypothetical protein ACOX2S_03015 [bacterium]